MAKQSSMVGVEKRSWGLPRLALALCGCAWVLSAGACSTVEPPTGSTSQAALSASPTLADLRGRFVKRFTSPDGEPGSEPVFPIGPATLSRSAGRISGTVVGESAAKVSVAEVPTSGVQVSARGGTAGFTLDGIGQVTAELAEGYVIFPHALAGKHTVLIRPSREGIEDFIVFESAPPIPKVTYTTKLDGVAGLRLVGNVLEMLDRTGTPVLRIRAPEIVDRDGKTIAAKLGVSGCAVDTNAAPPWDRSMCRAPVGWRADLIPIT